MLSTFLEFVSVSVNIHIENKRFQSSTEDFKHSQISYGYIN
jgi:hypothetical protein